MAYAAATTAVELELLMLDELIRARVAALASTPDDRLPLAEAMAILRLRFADSAFVVGQVASTNSARSGMVDLDDLPDEI